MKMYELKELLKNALENLEDYDDDQEVRTETNTYYVHGDFIGISGVGFVQLDDPAEKDYDEDDEEDEE